MVLRGKSTHVRIGARDRNRSVITSLVQRQTHHRVMTETRHMTMVQCTVQMYIQNVQCRQPWRNGQKRQHRPARSRRVFSFVVVVALHQLGAAGGFFWGSEGYPGSPQTTNLSTISPPREGQSLDVVEWILIGFLHLFTPDVLLELEVDAFL